LFLSASGLSLSILSSFSVFSSPGSPDISFSFSSMSAGVEKLASSSHS